MNWSLESAETAAAPQRGGSEMDEFIRRNVMMVKTWNGLYSFEEIKKAIMFIGRVNSITI